MTGVVSDRIGRKRLIVSGMCDADDRPRRCAGIRGHRPCVSLSPSERLIPLGSLVVVAAAAVGDPLMLALTFPSVAAASPSTPVVLVVTASVARLAVGAVAGSRCLHTRRSLTQA